MSFHVVDLLFASEDAAYVLCEQQTRLSLEVAMDQAFGAIGTRSNFTGRGCFVAAGREKLARCRNQCGFTRSAIPYSALGWICSSCVPISVMNPSHYVKASSRVALEIRYFVILFLQNAPA